MVRKCDFFTPIRKYIQFNDLVIDNFDMLVDASLAGGFKNETMEYSYGHGSYVGFKSQQQYSKEQSLSMTLKLDYRKLRKEQRRFYKDWVNINLSRIGKLWAIEGDQLLWTNAFVTNFSEPYTLEKFIINIDVDFILYEGVWHKADSRKTFLQPYTSCDFMECLDFRESNECLDCCISCKQPNHKICKACACDCDTLNVENSLCELKKEIAYDFYKQCGDSYRIIYNCEAANNLWKKDSTWGQKFCKDRLKNSIIAGRFYSGTVLESENIVIRITGIFKNPIITINGNTLQILGEFNGTLTVHPNGDVYYQDGCCPEEIPIDVENIHIPKCNTLGFTIRHGENSFIVDTNECCENVCVYFKVDEITI